ncbi:hypothetical protein [Amycolatopsis acidicola]|uniref:hypothetical protein n=1 Tax=Amycolatopsis acidicola TaxID=2596893 RepID=UPI001AA04E2B|nr:hypothetical protein [Amycolatopsis acidicola]
MLNDDVQYPVKPLEENNDPRFTFGLLLDVAAVLQEQGYPRIRTGADLIRLRQALWSFLYSTNSV